MFKGVLCILKILSIGDLLADKLLLLLLLLMMMMMMMMVF